MRKHKILLTFFTSLIHAFSSLKIDYCDPDQTFKYEIFGENNDNFRITLSDREVLTFKNEKTNVANLYFGRAKTDYKEFHAHFFRHETLDYKIPADRFEIVDGSDDSEYDFTVNFGTGNNPFAFDFQMKFICNQKVKETANIEFYSLAKNSEYNQFWIRFSSHQNEQFYGGGEQHEFLNLKGRRLSMIIQDKVLTNQEVIDLFSNYQKDMSSYWVAPIFVSSDRYFFTSDSTTPDVVDFQNDEYVEYEIHSGVEVDQEEEGITPNFPITFTFSITYDTFGPLFDILSDKLGRVNPLPEWLQHGATLGLQGGSERVNNIVQEGLSHNVDITGIWIQDWSGRKTTNFGDRVFWNWEWDDKRYPTLKDDIEAYQKNGTYWLVYINPHLDNTGRLFEKAKNDSVLIVKRNGDVLIQNFGAEFDCGTVDFTFEKGRQWYKENIIFPALDLGIRGWMADFAEYIPLDNEEIYLACENETTGSESCTAQQNHNKFASDFAKLNYEAILEYENLGANEVFIFHRSGNTESNKYAMHSWAGDQLTSWDRKIGLPSAIVAGLSLGMSGYPYSHSDIGGYQSPIIEPTPWAQYRSKELLFRWAEMSIFSTAMRTHEGNRPDINAQVYSDTDSWQKFARLTDIRKMLQPYIEDVQIAAHTFGWPMMRPLFFHYPNDSETTKCTFDSGISPSRLLKKCPMNYQYMFGRDLLVAPIITKNTETHEVYFPFDDKYPEYNIWINLWDSSDIIDVSKTTRPSQRYFEVTSRIGEPSVYYRNGTDNDAYFRQFQKFQLFREDFCVNSWSVEEIEDEETNAKSWHFKMNNQLIFTHSKTNPILSFAKSQPIFTETGSNGGNFLIEPTQTEKFLLSVDIDKIENLYNANGSKIGIRVYFQNSYYFDLNCHDLETDGLASNIEISLFTSDKAVNQANTIILNLEMNSSLKTSDKLFGAGEQYNYFNLNDNQEFNILVNEQGVGRGDNLISLASKAAGDTGRYDTTYWSMPVFVGEKFWIKSNEAYYHRLNLKEPFSDLEIYLDQVEEGQTSVRLDIGAVQNIDSMKDNLIDLKTSNKWRQKSLPDWSIEGSILGVQGGSERMLDIYNDLKSKNVEINGIWIQDWSGQISTDFGKRVFWNWQWNEERYPELDKIIKDLKENDNTHILVYMTPHLNIEGDLFKKADQDQVLIQYYNEETDSLQNYLQDFGEFFCGAIDLTSETGRNWYINNIINPALDLGIRGYMADFGEYLQIDENLRTSSGEKLTSLHNKYPAYWALTNHEAVQFRCRSEEDPICDEDLFLFYRAGHTDSNKYVQTTWAGDQNVDWSRSDGFPSVIPAALSLGMSGMSTTHIDIGLYTTMINQTYDSVNFDVIRCKELLLRTAEYAVFTPVMRTHESNRPDSNWQVYTDDDTINRYSRLTIIHKILKPYLDYVIKYEAQSLNLPVQRPLCLEFPNDFECDNSDHHLYQFMLGSDVLVAPVITPNTKTQKVVLPTSYGTWVHLWTGTKYENQRTIEVDAIVGNIPVFYKQNSEFSDIFDSLAEFRVVNDDFVEQCVGDEVEPVTDAPVTDIPVSSNRLSSAFFSIFSLFLIFAIHN